MYLPSGKPTKSEARYVREWHRVGRAVGRFLARGDGGDWRLVAWNDGVYPDIRMSLVVDGQIVRSEEIGPSTLAAILAAEVSE